MEENVGESEQSGSGSFFLALVFEFLLLSAFVPLSSVLNGRKCW